MRQTRHYIYQSSLMLALGLLIGCAPSSPPSATLAPTTSIPTNPAASETAAPAYPIPLQTTTNAAYPAGPFAGNPSAYPGPSSQQQPTEQPLQGPPSILFPAPVLGVVVDGDMRVLSIEAASAAAAAGVQLGDQLATLDGIPLDSQMQAVKEHIGAARQDQAIRLIVRRGADMIELNVVPSLSHPPSNPTSQPGQVVPTATPVVPPNDYL